MRQQRRGRIEDDLHHVLRRGHKYTVTTTKTVTTTPFSGTVPSGPDVSLTT